MRCAWAITCSKGFIERFGGPKHSVALGALLIVLAFACVAVMSAFGKAAKDVSTGHMVFFQNFISLILFSPWVLRKGFSELRTSRIWLHILRAVGGLLSQALMFAAVRKMPLVDAVLLSNSAPLFIPLVAWIWLKEKIGGIVWISLSVGFAGVILILAAQSGAAFQSSRAFGYQRGALFSLRAGLGKSTLKYRTRTANPVLLLPLLLRCRSSLCRLEVENSHLPRLALTRRHRSNHGVEPVAHHLRL
jgi:drug/metabolite transporter (DMT)-like permease